MPSVVVIRSSERFETTAPGIVTRHLLSFGAHYDPERIAIGPLRALNDTVLDPGAGFDAHEHSGVEIVTWVVEGALEHEDSTGSRGIVRPGQVQRLYAGSGVTHVERDAGAGGATRFIQMWLDADAAGDPDYADADAGDEPLAAGWVLVAARPAAVDARVSLHNGSAALLATRLSPGAHQELFDGGAQLVFVARGRVRLTWDDLESVELGDGDTVQIDGVGVARFTGLEDSELLVWLLG